MKPMILLDPVYKSHFAFNNTQIFESLSRFKANFQKACKIKKSSQPCVFYVKSSYFLVFCAIEIKHILSIFLKKERVFPKMLSESFSDCLESQDILNEFDFCQQV